jgi:hypothetical protein
MFIASISTDAVDGSAYRASIATVNDNANLVTDNLNVI